ncbi:MAG: DNA translocase FtsK [Patescibacteria group bacterium]|nr:DNA translocase FtsK [Patescibacteria group bacterium]
MSRKKSLVKIPFFKFKINKFTIFNILGFFLIGLSLLMFLSFSKSFSSENSGKYLFFLNNFLKKEFGGLSIFLPLIIILFSIHFFNSKKLKFIKPNITFGLLMVYISLLGVFNSGEKGKLIFENLVFYFSKIGALLILFISFFIGLVLFFDTSIDVFLIYIYNLLKSIILFFKTYLFKNKKDKFLLNNLKKNEPQLITDKKNEQKQKQEILPIFNQKQQISSFVFNEQQQEKKDIYIKPLSLSQKTSTWIYPPLSILSDINNNQADYGDVNRNAMIIEQTLDSFGIRAKVEDVNKGPTVTQYAIAIAMGTKLSKVTALANNLALSLATTTGQVRIEAPIPGRSLVGIEIPNIKPAIVTQKVILSSSIFSSNNDPLLVPLGLDVSGNPIADSISRMPHVLIAGATGSGKSVLLNSWICSFLFRTRPDQLRLILVDPKRVELSVYNDVPHLLTPVIVEAEKIISALKWTVNEMEARYKLFAQYGVRNIESYNQLKDVEKKPYIVFVIDELADLMIFAPGEAEELITRIAQMARATGIHLVLATQRPSVDVITGLMKANIPTRIAFNVSSMIDSRVIIDSPGAEKLLGKGDMLYLPPDKAKPIRIQGPFITEKDVHNLVKFLKAQVPEVHYTEEVTEQPVTLKSSSGTISINGGDKDPLFNQALEIIMQQDKASASLLQRRLSIGYARAARILDQMEAEGYVGPAEGSKPRDVIKRQVENKENH